MTGFDNADIHPRDPGKKAPGALDVPLDAPIGKDGSSVENTHRTRSYVEPVPNILDQTVISGAPMGPGAGEHVGMPSPMRDIGEALVGQRLGHFQLEEFVGGGGMGAVFRANDTQLERTVAVKVLTQRYGGKEETVRRFRIEAQSAARLNHENIATVFFVGEDKGWNFIVFEFIEGENVRDLVAQSGPMEIGLALSCTAQVAIALQHAADRDVVHRDIKPSNVLLTPDGRAKLVDMGLARLRQVESCDDDLTVSGVTLGTFDYISPEQGRDPRNADVRSDLYSLGCTLYYMLTGRPPFPDRTVLQKLLSHTSDPPPDPRALRPGIPDDVAEITLRLLAKRPQDRYDHPSLLIDDILTSGERNHYAFGITSLVTSQSPGRTSHSYVNNMSWLVPALLLLCAVFAADSLLDRSGTDPETLPTFVLPAGGPKEAGEANLSIDPMDWTNALATDADPSPADSVQEPTDSGRQTMGLSSPDRVVDPSFPATPFALGAQMEGGEGDESVAVTSVESVAETLNTAFPVASGRDGDVAAAGDRAHAMAGTNPVPVNASVDIIVSQPSEFGALSSGEGDFLVVTSLAEALDMASANSSLTHIQVRTDRVRVTGPLTIDCDRLRISAADGFTPVLSFEPVDSGYADTARERLSMIQVHRGSIRFEGIHFELDTRSLRRACSLFTIEQAEMLALSDAWIRVIGDRAEVVSDETAVIDVAMVPRPFEMLDSLPSSLPAVAREAPALELQCRNIVFCGEATFLRAFQARPLRMRWTNGFIATSRSLAEIGGVPSDPRHGEQIQLDVDQVTAVLDKGLCRCIATPELPYLLTVDLGATRSILVTPEDQPLITSIGQAQSVEQLEPHLLFSGERNFYEATEVFWERLQRSENDTEPVVPIRLGFDEWQRRWQTEERRWHRNKVLWQTAADPNLPRYETTPGDFMLSDVPNNPARRAGGGVQRSDAGFQAALLPRSPNPVK